MGLFRVLLGYVQGMFKDFFRGLSDWDFVGVCLKRNRDRQSTEKTQAERCQAACSRGSTSKGK